MKNYLTSTTTTTRFGVGEIHSNVSAIKLLVIEAGDSSLSLSITAICDEAKATRATGVAVLHYDRLL